jgi:hypothetical protein
VRVHHCLKIHARSTAENWTQLSRVVDMRIVGAFASRRPRATGWTLALAGAVSEGSAWQKPNFHSSPTIVEVGAPRLAGSIPVRLRSDAGRRPVGARLHGPVRIMIPFPPAGPRSGERDLRTRPFVRCSCFRC